MRYLGGKSRPAREIAGVLNSLRQEGAPSYDVLCGGLSIPPHMKGERFANDACVPLINMYLKWGMGWRPPEIVSREDYERLKSTRDPDDPMTAFAGFALSFGGKYFGGYAGGWSDQDSGKYRYNQTAQMTAALDLKMQACGGVHFTCMDYADLEIPDGALAYLDPPYRGATGYAAVAPFDHERFDAWALELSKRCTVVLSEYASPGPAWTQVWSRRPGSQLSVRRDRLFVPAGTRPRRGQVSMFETHSMECEDPAEAGDRGPRVFTP